MAAIPNDTLFWVVLLAPGFISVIIATTLSALERDLPTYYLIFASLSSSVIIDSIFVSIYGVFGGDPSEMFAQGGEYLLEPEFRIDIIASLLLLSVIVGVFYSIGIIYGVPRRFREYLWTNRNVTGHKGQPWQTFLQKSGQIRVKTSDNQLFSGMPIRWNNDDREKELVIQSPHRYNTTSEEYEPAGGEQMLFTESDISRVLQQQTRDQVLPGEDNSNIDIPSKLLAFQIITITPSIFVTNYIIFDEWVFISLVLSLIVVILILMSLFLYDSHED